MMEKTLLLVEASGIQEYIFGSNQLAQNIGASELVRRATEEWVKKRTTRDQRVYVGGGNAMLLFEAETEADTFARKLTRQALEEAPGLQLVVARQNFEAGRLRKTHQTLRGELAKRKLNRRPSTPLLGLRLHRRAGGRGAQGKARSAGAAHLGRGTGQARCEGCG
jgi:hypothetical protein